VIAHAATLPAHAHAGPSPVSRDRLHRSGGGNRAAAPNATEPAIPRPNLDNRRV